MAEYIDREEYCEKHCRCSNEYCDKESCPIWKAPAADVAPVVHGKWIHLGGDEWCCSACGFVITTEGSGISLLKNTARIAAQGWTVVLKYGKFDGNQIRM